MLKASGSITAAPPFGLPAGPQQRIQRPEQSPGLRLRDCLLYTSFDTFNIFKWIFKTFVATYLLTNCFTIVMAVFDLAQNVV